MVVAFQLNGEEFLALNGGPQFTFSPAISFVVNCESQQEIDELWEKLSEGGATQQCGWLQDKYGVSWQIVPTILGKMMEEGDSKKTERVMEALLQMIKIDTETLMKAHTRIRPSSVLRPQSQFSPILGILYHQPRSVTTSGSPVSLVAVYRVVP
jgi:3-demethylubiquinone-9 3-methyltransferase